MHTLLLATHNPGKVREIREILSDLSVRFLTLGDFPELNHIEEDAATFEENALKKARCAFAATQIPTLADDSGLEVYALKMKPGVMSARYAGSGATDEQRLQKLLVELEQLGPVDRRAQFRCVAVLVSKGIERVSEGICTGEIIPRPRGTSGFGYDPIFQPDGFDLTFAEFPSEIKNQISHRGRALQRIRPILEDLLR